MPKLLHFPLDPFSRRMRLALAEYGVAFELVEERPWTPSETLFNLNPAGIVPVYVEDGGAAVSGIEAITEYLEETRAGKVAPYSGHGKRARRGAAAHGLVRHQILCGGLRTDHHGKNHPPLHDARNRRRCARHGAGALRAFAAARPSRLHRHAGRPPLVAGGRGAFHRRSFGGGASFGASTISAIFRGRTFRWPSAGTRESNRARPSGRCSATRCAACRLLPAYADLDF